MELFDEAFVLSQKGHQHQIHHSSGTTRKSRISPIRDVTPTPSSKTVVSMDRKNSAAVNQEQREKKSSKRHSGVSSVSSTASKQNQGRKVSSTGRATHVNPYVQVVMKKKFRSADRKREEELLNEMSEQKRLDYLAETSHFSSQEVESLALMFHALTAKSKTPNEMDRLLFKDTFRVLFDVTDDVMLDQIFCFFDADREGTISETEWIKNIGIILRGNLDEHCEYCFSVYDLNGDRYIGKSETMALIHHCMGKQFRQIDMDELDAVRDIAELIYRKLDPQGTGRVTPALFRRAVHKDPTLLECLGQCLPSNEKTVTFLHFVSENWKNFQTSYSLPQFPSYIYEKARYELDIDELPTRTARKLTKILPSEILD